MKATREQVTEMLVQAGLIEPGCWLVDGNKYETLVHLAQQFTLDQIRAQGNRVYMAGSYAKFLDRAVDHVPLGGQVSFVNLNWKDQIELFRIPETLE